MITIGTSTRAIAVIRDELKNSVLPHLTDKRAISTLQMVDFALRQLQTANDHQIEWLCEEIASIENMAKRAELELPGDAAVHAAIRALQETPADSLSLESLTRRYSLAGEVLSSVIESVIDCPGPLLDEVLGIMDRRLERELQIRGEFQAVGQE